MCVIKSVPLDHCKAFKNPQIKSGRGGSSIGRQSPMHVYAHQHGRAVKKRVVPNFGLLTRLFGKCTLFVCPAPVWSGKMFHGFPHSYWLATTGCQTRTVCLLLHQRTAPRLNPTASNTYADPNAKPKIFLPNH